MDAWPRAKRSISSEQARCHSQCYFWRPGCTRFSAGLASGPALLCSYIMTGALVEATMSGLRLPRRVARMAGWDGWLELDSEHVVQGTKYPGAEPKTRPSLPLQPLNLKLVGRSRRSCSHLFFFFSLSRRPRCYADDMDAGVIHGTTGSPVWRVAFGRGASSSTSPAASRHLMGHHKTSSRLASWGAADRHGGCVVQSILLAECYLPGTNSPITSAPADWPCVPWPPRGGKQ